VNAGHHVAKRVDRSTPPDTAEMRESVESIGLDWTGCSCLRRCLSDTTSELSLLPKRIEYKTFGREYSSLRVFCSFVHYALHAPTTFPSRRLGTNEHPHRKRCHFILTSKHACCLRLIDADKTQERSAAPCPHGEFSYEKRTRARKKFSPT
jgi:hypothetical protein